MWHTGATDTQESRRSSHKPRALWHLLASSGSATHKHTHNTNNHEAFILRGRKCSQHTPHTLSLSLRIPQRQQKLQTWPRFDKSLKESKQKQRRDSPAAHGTDGGTRKKRSGANERLKEDGEEGSNND